MHRLPGFFVSAFQFAGFPLVHYFVPRHNYSLPKVRHCKAILFIGSALLPLVLVSEAVFFNILFFSSRRYCGQLTRLIVCLVRVLVYIRMNVPVFVVTCDNMASRLFVVADYNFMRRTVF